jgi:site-specific DNA-methyltransferase (adenine-specific)
MRSTGITARQINEITDSFMGSHYLTDREQPAVPTEEMFSKLRPHLPTVPDDIEELVRMRTVEAENFKARKVVSETRVDMFGEYEVQDIRKMRVGMRIPLQTSAQHQVAITAPNTDLAKEWHGWGTALKPAYEPAILARKPLRGTVADNVAQWGVGGLNIDGCRVECSDSDAVPLFTKYNTRPGTSFAVGSKRTGQNTNLGRWPANVILDEDAAAALDAQSGERGGGYGVRGKSPSGRTYANGAGYANTLQVTGQIVGYGDSGGASRFFYTAKASRSEREAGLDGVEAKQAGSMRGHTDYKPRLSGDGKPITEPQRANHHPTVKPIALMRYMIRLVAPRGAVVLDPFMGSGSTGCAAMIWLDMALWSAWTERVTPCAAARSPKRSCPICWNGWA